MAQDDVINIDPFVLQRLQKSAAQALTTSSIPTPPTVNNVGSQPSYLPTIGVGMAALAEDIDFDPDPLTKSKAQLVKEAGILNEGIPTDLRFELSTTTLFNEALQKKNVEYNLQRYFKDKKLIDPSGNYDFGLRVGPISGRLEFKDPRFDGKYNVLDPFGAKDIVGDIADISMDVILPIATEVTTGLGFMAIPGVGQVPLTPILAGSAAAFVTSLGRLNYAKNQNLLAPGVDDDAILSQAQKEAGFSALGGVAGPIVFKVVKPVLRAMGLANPKFAVDIDEDTFLKAYNKFIASPAGKKAAEMDVMPSSAQILEKAADSANVLEKSGFQAAATELAEQEARIATAPTRDIAEGVTEPSLQRTAAAEEAIRREAAAEPAMPAGVRGTATRLTEADQAALGSEIQTVAAERAAQQTSIIENNVSQQLTNVERAIDDALNLPASIQSTADIGLAAKEAIGDAYDSASQSLGKAYEELFTRWSEKTGISLDSVVVGKGGIKPTEAVDFAVQIRNTLPDRPFATTQDNQVINKVLDSFLVSEKGAIRKVKPISLRTLNENIRDLRRLERKAFNASQRGEDAPSPEVISGMVEALETARNRVISRKGAPEGMADELRGLDDQFADFSRRFRGVQTSAVAKLRTAKNPETAWSLLFQKDGRGGTAVLDIAEELNTPANRDLFNDVSNAVRNKWLNTVVKRDPSSGEITKVDVGAHNRFVKEYGSVMDSYLSPAERAALGNAREFAETVANIQSRKKVDLTAINRQFDLGGGKVTEPELVFEQSWKNNRFTRFDELYTTLRRSPELMDTYKAFVYKDMFNPAAGRVKTVNGRQVLDPEQMKTYVDENKAKLSTLFGQEYVNNLNTVLEVTKAALTDVPRRGAKRETNILTTAIRSYVGVFTRPGRFLTAANKIRGRIKQDALTTALADPRVMAQAAKAARQSPLSKEAERIFGRILTGRYDDPTNENLPVARPTQAQALLNELYGL